MDTFSAEKLILDAFHDAIRKEKSENAANNYRLAAQQLIDYVREQPEEDRWLTRIKDAHVASDFIDAKFGTALKSTQDGKKDAVQAFQDYLNQHGWLDWVVAWIVREQNRPLIVLCSIFLSAIIVVITFMSFFGWSPERVTGQFWPSPTPTITNTLPPTRTPTETLTPSPTLTLTPTITPTPNATQILLATQTPTANPAFSPMVMSKADGSKQVWVPAGSFMMGDHTGKGFPDEVLHQVYTDGFWIDQFLVTNKQFAECPGDLCGQPQSLVSHKRPHGYYGVSEFADFPVIEITWGQAETFCQWRGGRLPTEAEWEKAAGWDPRTSQMRIYPWGDQSPNKTLANYNNVDVDTTEIGNYPKGVSSVGAYDMAGNVWEWIFDWHGPYNLRSSINPVGPESGEFKVIRGGSWANTTFPTFLRVSNRGRNTPDHTSNEIGFRCVFTH